MANIAYCLNSSTIRPAPLMEKIQIAAEAGYEAIELWNDDLTAHQEAGGSLRDVAQALSDRGLRCANLYCGPRLARLNRHGT